MFVTVAVDKWIICMPFGTRVGVLLADYLSSSGGMDHV